MRLGSLGTKHKGHTMKITTKETNVWLTEHSYIGPDDFKEGMSSDAMAFYDHDMTSSGWTKVGTAVITMEVVDKAAMVESKIESLRALQTKTIADAQAKSTEIEGQIQKLLAISHEGS